MRISSLVLSEIVHRKLNFAIALLAVSVAVASSVGVMTLIRSYQLQSVQRVAELDDEIRKITKNMGFNITILPKNQNLADFHATDFAKETMPYEFVDRLAQSKDVVTINHLRPALIQKVEWPEQNREILLMGVSGVVPSAHLDTKQPLSQPVPRGSMNVGHILARELGLEEGNAVTLRDVPFQVGKIYPQRGSKDDITVWIDLEAAQKMFQLEGRVNMIQALECNCASIDRLGEIQSEISALLGDEVQVIEFETTALARAKAREEVKASGSAAVARVERYASLLLPLVILGASLLVGLVFLSNVRERRSEIGILRAVGTRWRQVVALFVSKAFLVGLLGALAGYAAGLVIAYGCSLTSGLAAGAAGRADVAITLGALFQPLLLLAVLVLTPLVAILASWLPAMAAAGQDPAVVLREE